MRRPVGCFRQHKNLQLSTVAEAPASSQDPRSYFLLGALLGGIGVGIPLTWLYLFEKYELDWLRKMHGDFKGRNYAPNGLKDKK